MKSNPRDLFERCLFFYIQIVFKDVNILKGSIHRIHRYMKNKGESMTYCRCIIVALLIVISGCMTSINQVRTTYNRSDLHPAAVDAVPKNINHLYKLDPTHAVDYMVIMVRMNILSATTTQNLGEVLLSFYPMEKEKYFDCSTFYSKLTESEKNMVDERMRNHPFICNNPDYSKEDALKSFPDALTEKINFNNTADSHWAWFGATGDKQILKRFLDNYLYNPDSCLTCIAWSFSSNAHQNNDVKNYLIEYMTDKTEEEKEYLKVLLPKEETATYNNSVHWNA